MKFIIDGQEFEAVGLERITGAMALDLPRQAGIGLQQIARRLQEMPRLGYDASGAAIVVDEKIARPVLVGRLRGGRTREGHEQTPGPWKTTAWLEAPAHVHSCEREGLRWR